MRRSPALRALACVIATLSLRTTPAAAQEDAQGDGAARETDAVVDEADRRHARGQELYAQGNFDAALAEFERAYELLGNHPERYRILYNIARAHERRFRYDLAMRYYRRYLDEGGPEAPERASVEAKIEALGELLATLHVTVNVRRAQVWVGERHVGEAPGDVLVPGGRHALEVRADGYVPARREIQVAAGTEESLSFELTAVGAVSPPAGLEPSWFWMSALAGGATALAGGGFGIAALARRAEVDQAHAEGRRVGDGPRNEIQSYAIAADVFFGATALLAVTAFVLALFTDFDGEPAHAEGALRVEPGRLGWGLVW